MVQHSGSVLDRTFAALSDPTRREILERLGAGPASVSDLAEPFGISLPGLLKHVRALEDVELVVTTKRGRTRWCALGPSHRGLDEAAEWLATRRRTWERRLDRFQDLAEGKGPR